jgi:hypothetical protein
VTSSKVRDIWYTHCEGDGRQRVVAVEYQDGWPVSVLTELHWDHSRKPWFDPAKHPATGTCAEWWDFDWCKRDGTLRYHNSGSGGEIRFHVARFVHPTPPKAELWVADGLPVVTAARRKDGTWGERRVGAAELLRRGYARIARPRSLPLVNAYPYRKVKTTLNPFEAGWEGDTIYCDRCDDHLPSEDTYRPCDHVEWCDECGMWVYTDDQTYLESSSGKHECKGETEDDD